MVLSMAISAPRTRCRFLRVMCHDSHDQEQGLYDAGFQNSQSVIQ